MGTPKSAEDEQRNTLYVFDYNGLTVAHFGQIDQPFPPRQRSKHLGPVNIALIPVGDATSLNAAKAAEVISLIEPNIVIPMHYATDGSHVKLDELNKFLKKWACPINRTAPFKIGSSHFPARRDACDRFGLSAQLIGALLWQLK